MRPRAPCEDWAAARHILLIRLDSLGDVLMSTPAMAAVRESLPAAALTLLTSSAGAALAPHLPWLDRVMVYEAPWMKRRCESAAEGPEVMPAELDHVLLNQLRAGGFDAAIIFSTCTQSALPAALLCRLAGIRLCLAHSREQVYGLLSHRRPETDVLGPSMRHEVQRQLDLVAGVGLHTSRAGLRFELLPEDQDRVRQWLAERGLEPGQPYVLLHPGASAASRRYPAQALASAAALLRQTRPVAAVAEAVPAVVDAVRDLALVACAGPDEAGLLRQLGEALDPPPVLLEHALSLGELAALVADARVLVANNSGPVHLAAALGTPVVALYALTNPQHTPWRVPSRVLSRQVPCRDCLQSVCPQGHHRCLTGVAPAEVAQAARELLEERAL